MIVKCVFENQQGILSSFRSVQVSNLFLLRVTSCSVVMGPSGKSCMTGPSTKCFYFNELLFMRVRTVVRFQSAMFSRFCVKPTSKRRFLKIVQVTMQHDLFDAM